jgi:hypothetical protein
MELSGSKFSLNYDVVKDLNGGALSIVSSENVNKQSNASPSFRPYLSVVAASRNDDHGGDPLIRSQIFIDNFARQCEKYGLPAELIIVDWNPVADRPGLAAVLSIPSESAYCQGRVITVPAVLHNRLKYADKLPFFQMIAKNVGIRRARGDFILATNIDIIFSDELMRFIGRQKLNPKKLYRVDRYDIKSGLSREWTLDESLEYAWANPIRAARRYQPKTLVDHLYGEEIFKRTCIPDLAFCRSDADVEVVEEDGVWQIRPDRTAKMTHLHTNACGDFTLLPRDGWYAVRGYPEFEAFSFNVDSIGFVAAHYAGYEEVSLLPPCVCFHIEHGMGSGWTPEGEKKLFGRLREAGILNPEWPVLTPLVDAMREQGTALEFNHARWGMAEFDLPEQVIGDSGTIPDEKLEQLALQAKDRAVSAIQPTYDLDRLTLAYERQLAREQSLLSGQGLGLAVASSSDPLVLVGSMVCPDAEKVVLFIPDSVGSYSETRKLACHAQLTIPTTLAFRIEQFDSRFPMRFDPCQCPGLITIHSMIIFDAANHRMVWDLRDSGSAGPTITGTAIPVDYGPRLKDRDLRKMLRRGKKSRQPFTVISTGLDPQLILPLLPNNIGFPLIMSIEMRVLRYE